MKFSIIGKAFVMSAILCGGASTRSFSQEVTSDTLKITVDEAEGVFLKNNYGLILGRYNVDKAKAGIITAKLFDNPEVSYENIVYNPDTRKFFQTSSADGQGQYIVQYSQLLKLAGKRKKQIQLAGNELKQSEYDFEDLMRSLRYTLRTDFFKLYYNQRSMNVYFSEINSLQKTLNVFEVQYGKGNISEKEVLRIKSLLASLRAELTSLQNSNDDLSAEIRTMLSLGPDKSLVAVVADNEDIGTNITSLKLSPLIDTALLNRPDFKRAHAETDYAAINLRLQKANAVPDLTVTGVYDLQGSSVKRYTGLGLSIPLPLFNRNQGAIKQANIDVDASGAQLKSKELAIRNDVSNSYHTLQRQNALASAFNQGFSKDLDRLMEGMNTNFQRRNIGILEFIDFYSSYRENTLQRNQAEADLLCAVEELNYQVGRPVLAVK